MSEFLQWVGYALLGVLVAYLVPRLISAAIYESRRHYEGKRNERQDKIKG